MLTKESSQGFFYHINYPVYEYRSKKGNRIQAYCDGGRMIPTPRGYSEVIRYHNIDEEFEDYLKWIKEDHKDFTNAQLLENPYGIYIGRKKNARWMDEIKRRGLS